MDLPELPDDILIKILVNIGEEEYINLSLFIRVGKRSYSLVHTEEVLKKCNLWRLCQNPENIYPGGIGRRFFEKCFQNGNCEAIYYEALRVVMREANFHEGVRILDSIIPDHEDATLASAIFSVCIGDTLKASSTFQLFVQHHGDLTGDNAISLAEALLWELTWFDPPYMNMNSALFNYPNDEHIKTPRLYFPARRLRRRRLGLHKMQHVLDCSPSMQYDLKVLS